MKNNSIEMNEAKNQALQTAISQIEKNFGKGSIMRLGEDAADKSVEVFQQVLFLLILPLV